MAVDVTDKIHDVLPLSYSALDEGRYSLMSFRELLRWGKNFFIEFFMHLYFNLLILNFGFAFFSIFCKQRK
jgi:hypothetical protein